MTCLFSNGLVVIPFHLKGYLNLNWLMRHDTFIRRVTRLEMGQHVYEMGRVRVDDS